MTDSAHSFRYCLNTSTIAGAELGVAEEIAIAAEAGYDGVEVWIPSLEAFVEGGGRLVDLASMARDRGISIENTIGFAPWIVDDEAARNDGLEQARRDMDMAAEIGCGRIAAPPAGAVDAPHIGPTAIADRFERLLDLGLERGVTPQLEFWGFSSNLHDLDQALAVASLVARPETRLLIDVYHLRRGGSSPRSLDRVDGSLIDIVHLNDYPASIPAVDLDDSDRVYPGTGDAPLTDLITSLHGMETDVSLSLELFNRSLWKQDPLEVATTGLRAMTDAVAVALS